MKSLTILALLVAVCAVFLSVGHTEETTDDFKEPAFEDATNDEELSDSFENTEDEEDDEEDDEESNPKTLVETGNVLESVKETPSNDDDEPVMFKRAPWGRRRWRIRVRVRRVVRKVCRYFSWHPDVGWKCAVWDFVGGDEESPNEQAGQNEAKWLGEE